MKDTTMSKSTHRASEPQPNPVDPTSGKDQMPPAREATRAAALIAGGSFYTVAALLVLFEYLRG